MGQGDIWDVLMTIRGPASTRYIAQKAGRSFGSTSNALAVMSKWGDITQIGSRPQSMTLYCIPGREMGIIHLTDEQRDYKQWTNYRRDMICGILQYGNMTTSQIARNLGMEREEVYSDMEKLVRCGKVTMLHKDGWGARPITL